MRKGALPLLAALVILSVSFTTAQYSIDISGLKTEDYSLGEEITYRVIVLEGSEETAGEVTVTFSDALEKKTLQKTVPSNTDQTLIIEDTFASGLWIITAHYQNSVIERTVTIGENSQVEFILQTDELTIQNTGNVRYTKTVRITIGDSTNSYAQNLGIGEEKTLQLISPEGIYNIEITDGQRTLKRENVQLFGTGNVVGAVDRELVGYTGFAGADDPRSADARQLSLDKLPLSLVFIGAVAGLAILVFIERKVSRGKKKSAKRGKK